MLGTETIPNRANKLENTENNGKTSVRLLKTRKFNTKK